MSLSQSELESLPRYKTAEVPRVCDPDGSGVRNGWVRFDDVARLREQSSPFARAELGLRLGQILGRDYDGVPLDEVAIELVRVKAEVACAHDVIARLRAELEGHRVAVQDAIRVLQNPEPTLVVPERK